MSPWQKMTVSPPPAQTSIQVGADGRELTCGTEVVETTVTVLASGQNGLHGAPPPQPHASNATLAPARASSPAVASLTSSSTRDSRAPSGMNSSPARLKVPERAANRPVDFPSGLIPLRPLSRLLLPRFVTTSVFHCRLGPPSPHASSAQRLAVESFPVSVPSGGGQRQDVRRRRATPSPNMDPTGHV